MSVELNAPGPSHIVPAMSRATLILLLILAIAAPAFAQSSEVGMILGGTRRSATSVWNDSGPMGDDSFTFSNSSFEMFYGVELEPSTYLKFKLGRIETPVRVQTGGDPETGTRFGHDEDGEVQHLSTVVEYRFSEAFGRTALFGGLGMYRHVPGGGFEDEVDWGWQVGVNADFPLSRRYGVMLEAAHHWARGEFQPKYLTVGGGLRISF